ncbi:MAG: manganese efflux pump, partial [Defluviitaleaceae bacterium]|nr:manganese efflux pump [Defluviitaleaceae bacterium]
KEAIVLAVSLSLDGFAVGFSAAMLGMNFLAVIIFTLIVDFIALLLGGWLGNKAANKLRFNISWLAGLILIGLAVVQLL